ncbi:hypothetical protein F0562_023700 [Nyssa sinensis]|uniref:Uncharacterized protein n=1 Tax=Nyssa sinensis TaxID=561372 RepID=A0A5J5BIT3_9ASTE|nr:hypothetical protein F0562_023700 [Nyssa sinensis]
MDFWVVVAAAGAGYIAKHWQNLLRDRESSSRLSSEDSSFVKPESPALIRSKSFPIHRLPQTKKLNKDVLVERELVAQDASTAEVASTHEIDGENLVNVGNYEDCNALCISGLVPNDDLKEDWEKIGVSGDMGENSVDSLLQTSTGKMRTTYGSSSNRSSFRNRRFNMQSIRPLSSLESCLIAQLYKEHAEMEEYVLSSVPSPSTPTVRPFFVTDGRRIISRARADSFSMQIGTGQNQLERGTYSSENDTVFGVPLLPNVGSLEFLGKTKVKTGKWRGGKLSSSNKMVNGKQLHSQAGSSHGVLLFCLGISVGIISSVLANKRELEKLNELLKQTENLVQDLQDELEMKDSLTVKELTNEDYQSQDTRDCFYNSRAPHSCSPEQNLGESTKCDVKELHNQKAQEYSESMSKIEAELEAELERLELNMNSSSLEGKLSDLVELDPDDVPDIVQAELRS